MKHGFTVPAPGDARDDPGGANECTLLFELLDRPDLRIRTGL